MHLSISQIPDLTGRDRRTVAKQLKDLQTSPVSAARFYTNRQKHCRSFMPWITQKPRARHRARSQAPLNAVREEDLRKQRIPIQIVLDLIDKVFQSIVQRSRRLKVKS
jgi:hypothetical protein